MVFVQGKLCSISKIVCRAVDDWFSFFYYFVCSLFFYKLLGSGVSPARKGNISRLALCLVRIVLKPKRFRKPTFISSQFGVGCITSQVSLSQEYITSTSQALTSQYRLEQSVWFTPQTERVIVLSKILAFNKSLTLLLSVISR